MGSARLASRSPEINGLAALRRQGYGLFAAKIWFKSHWDCDPKRLIATIFCGYLAVGLG